MPGGTAPSGPFVVALADVGRDDVARAGGKGANLGELVRAGFPVPAGFVVPTEVYRSVVAAHLEDSGQELTGDGSAIRAAVARVPIPAGLAADVAAAYRELGGGPVAVRSSATAEDLPGAAFAGQQDTYLDVTGAPDVLAAVRRCWASLWTDRAIAYRRRLGIPPSEVALAVVVQRMVPAEFAGVLFTADPVTGARDEVVVEAAPGLGEAVVSGTVTPDRFVVGADGRLLERRLADRGGTHLPDSAVTELAALGRRVAARFGRPQDVEWALARQQLALIQARPMTALPPPPLRLGPLRRKIGTQLLDYLHERPYPLDMSAWTVPGIGRLVERMLYEIAGVRIDFAAVLPEHDGVVDRFVPPSPRPTRATLSAPVRLLPRMRRFRPEAWTDDPRFAGFCDGVRALAALDVTGLAWVELVGLPRRALDVHEAVADLRVDYLPRAAADLLALRAVLTAVGLAGLFPDLVVGGRTRTEDANRALAGLARQARADGRLWAAFTDLDPADLVGRIEQDPAFADFRSGLARFCAEFGHRETTSLLLLSAPTWGDDLPTVLGLVRVLGEGGDRGAPERIVAARRRLTDHRLVRLTRSEPAVARVVDGARAAIAFREDTHFYATAVLPVVRRALLEAGTRLAAAGVLADRDDVLHLRLPEIEALPDPRALPAQDAGRIRTLVHRRAARRAELRGAPLIAASSLVGGVRSGRSGRSEGTNGAEVLVSGTAAGSGRATGAVRVVTGPAGFGSLRGGEVLVCPYTNPAWTPLFQRAAAVVVDSGGVGSHAAIVAREYGIPAVMGTGRGTALLTAGRLVTVDGDRGLVTAADRPGK